MRVTNLFRYALVAVMMSSLISYANAAVLSTYTIAGVTYDGGTCQPLAGVYVHSPTYSTAVNYSTSTGNYLLRLGRGIQTIEANYTGYNTVTFNTTYQAGGSILSYNIAMYKPGEAASSTPCSFAGTSTPGVTNSTTVPYNTSTVAVTTAPTTVAPTTPSPSSSSNTALIVGAVIVVIIIIGGVAYYLSQKKPPQHHEHHPEHHTS